MEGEDHNIATIFRDLVAHVTSQDPRVLFHYIYSVLTPVFTPRERGARIPPQILWLAGDKIGKTLFAKTLYNILGCNNCILLPGSDSTITYPRHVHLVPVVIVDDVTITSDIGGIIDSTSETSLVIILSSSMAPLLGFEHPSRRIWTLTQNDVLNIDPARLQTLETALNLPDTRFVLRRYIARCCPGVE